MTKNEFVMHDNSGLFFVQGGLGTIGQGWARGCFSYRLGKPADRSYEKSGGSELHRAANPHFWLA
jgi:hypothetical protein